MGIKISIKELVKEFYSEYGVKEWNRLTSDPYHWLEFGTTIHFLRKYLKKFNIGCRRRFGIG